MMASERKTTLMLVEDSVVDLRYLQMLLEEMGYSVVCTALSGEDAVEMALKEKPGLIIMDIVLSGKMSGIEAAAAIRRELKIPVVFATALSDKQTLDEIVIDDLYGYLIKPYNKKGLFSSIELAIRKHEYERERENLYRELEQKILDLNRAKENISLSEEKYRLLVEGSNEIIFSLDEHWNFLTANRSLRRQLNYAPETIQGMNFMDLIYADGESLTKQIVSGILRQFAQDRKAVSFKAEFKCFFTNEPKEMQVKLEYINIEGKNEILGKASRVAEDALMNYFISERQTFEIGNYLIVAEEISYRLTRNLVRYMDSREVTNVRIALREMIINAIEHGNLNIGFKEKSQALDSDSYFSSISQRQKDERYANRKILIDYAVDSRGVRYIITDEGEGFDAAQLLKRDLSKINEEMEAHGRGIALAREIFNSLQYNKKGNKVKLIKYFS